MSDRVVLILSDFIPVAEVVDIEMEEEITDFTFEDPIEVEFEVDADIDVILDDVDLEEQP